MESAESGKRTVECEMGAVRERSVSVRWTLTGTIVHVRSSTEVKIGVYGDIAT